MSISLSKGATISLSKVAGLRSVTMGLGWDAVQPPVKTGFFAKILSGASTPPAAIDLDASVIVFDAAKRVIETVSFRQLKSANGAIVHSGDNRTGEGDGDDESIVIDLTALPSNAVHLVFTVNSFTGQTFNEVDNAVCRLVDNTGCAEICRYTLSEKGAHTGVIMAVLTRASGEWVMKADGTTMNGRVASELAAQAQRII